MMEDRHFGIWFLVLFLTWFISMIFTSFNLADAVFICSGLMICILYIQSLTDRVQELESKKGGKKR